MQEKENVQSKQGSNGCVYSDELTYTKARPFSTMANYEHVTLPNFNRDYLVNYCFQGSSQRINYQLIFNDLLNGVVVFLK